MIPSTMRAAVLSKIGEPLAIETVPTPAVDSDHILVKVHACGVCHTDLHACRGDWRATPTLPLIPGHEIVGEIVDECTHLAPRDDLSASSQLPSSHLQRVGVFWLNRACGTCEYCDDGWESVCPRQVNTGFGVGGGYAEYVAVHRDFAVPIPDELEAEVAAPLLCAGVSAFKAIRETELRAGQTLAVVGCGGVGHLAVAYAKAAGLRVVALDVSDSPLSLAREMGADDAIAVNDLEAIRRLKKTGGVHGALITAGQPAAIRLGVDLLRRKGTAVVVGLPPGEFSLPTFDVVVKRFTIRGSIGGTRADVAAALATAAKCGIRPRVTVRRLDEINEVFADMEAGALKGRVVVRI